ncbi:unnamed protein product, partial [Porites evermanni]
SVATDFRATPAVQHNCMHINHTCLSAIISDLNHLFASAITALALKNNSTGEDVPSNKKKIEDNKKTYEIKRTRKFQSARMKEYSTGLVMNKKQTKCATPQMYIYQ